ncbi:hypothetical protein [Vibrio diazotrophicus]|uniref:hypothetical protein n=1 Tax=Vibrio diazotrophicus TaxID=685 RepID=UPI000C9E5284|nr:hypothetical protein [Vibrio diazotrophicus]PNH81277.1 hypothetical protein C1N27_06965 [Vibrio diazotrophicus]
MELTKRAKQKRHCKLNVWVGGIAVLVIGYFIVKTISPGGLANTILAVWFYLEQSNILSTDSIAAFGTIIAAACSAFAALSARKAVELAQTEMENARGNQAIDKSIVAVAEAKYAFEEINKIFRNTHLDGRLKQISEKAITKEAKSGSIIDNEVGAEFAEKAKQINLFLDTAKPKLTLAFNLYAPFNNYFSKNEIELMHRLFSIYWISVESMSLAYAKLQSGEILSRVHRDIAIFHHKSIDCEAILLVKLVIEDYMEIILQSKVVNIGELKLRLTGVPAVLADYYQELHHREATVEDASTNKITRVMRDLEQCVPEPIKR